MIPQPLISQNPLKKKSGKSLEHQSLESLDVGASHHECLNRPSYEGFWRVPYTWELLASVASWLVLYLSGRRIPFSFNATDDRKKVEPFKKNLHATPCPWLQPMEPLPMEPLPFSVTPFVFQVLPLAALARHHLAGAPSWFNHKHWFNLSLSSFLPANCYLDDL